MKHSSYIVVVPVKALRLINNETGQSRWTWGIHFEIINSKNCWARLPSINEISRNWIRNKQSSAHLPTPLLIIVSHWEMKAFFDKHELPGMGLLAVASFSRTSCSMSSNTWVKYGRLVQLRAMSKAWTPRLQWKKRKNHQCSNNIQRTLKQCVKAQPKQANAELTEYESKITNAVKILKNKT